MSIRKNAYEDQVKDMDDESHTLVQPGSISSPARPIHYPED
jgi:hypothetical protein